MSDGVENGCENYASNVVIGSLSEIFFSGKGRDRAGTQLREKKSCMNYDGGISIEDEILPRIGRTA